MDYEKKYKEAQKWIESIYSELSHEQQMEAEAFFPELKESEDERISKEIIKYLEQTVPHNHRDEVLKSKEWTAWLEKQGEQKPTLRERYKNIAESEWFKKTHEGMSVSDDEKVDNVNKIEQKPAWSDDKKLTDVNHEYFSELLENNDSEDINDYAYQVAYCMSHDWIEETATWDDVQKACKLGAEWKEKHWNNSSTAWSEEDEEHYQACLQYFDAVNPDMVYYKDYQWLKSLKERIGE